MKTHKVIALMAVVLTITVTAIFSAACSSRKVLVGKWSYSEPLSKITYVFNKGGTMENTASMTAMGGIISDKKNEGKYEVKKDKLIMSGLYLDVESKEFTYALSEDGKTLTLTRDGEDIVLTKVE
ncbi:MAG TPA: DUF5640 domain-containing protein [Oscillospiraceae bacterium]|nr:DUF5640 domain-containing protein [Oscillospiraceae bacterium]HPS34689.1 DUF5640 domain-containing protein [Oscillospiraceae bacterium]